MDSIASKMSAPVISIYSEASAREGAKLMQEKGIGSLLVKGYDGYVGIVTERDLVYKVVGSGLNPDTTPLSAIMTESILSIEKKASFSETGDLMREYQIRHLAVEENEEIIGILSAKDLIGRK
jgi:CBS domain-containing protein